MRVLQDLVGQGAYRLTSNLLDFFAARACSAAA